MSSMSTMIEALNNSVKIRAFSFASDEQSLIILIVNYVCLCSTIALFGIIANVINVIVFYKQGLDSSINITFFSLAISDLCGLLIQQWLDALVNPWLERTNAPLAPSEFLYMTGGIPRVLFSRITCLITVYMTMERCLCITFPLRVKQIITPRTSAIAMLAIYFLTGLTIAPLYCTASLGWKFYPSKNKTLLGLIVSSTNEQLTQIVYIVQAFLGSTYFTAVIVFTAILVRQLELKSSWRKSVNADLAKSQTMSNRDRKTISMVVLIASVLILCYIPSVVLLVATFIEPEFSVGGLHENICIALWGFGHVFETLNSTVNIFLYLKMSTKYRETFFELFVCIQKPADSVNASQTI